MNHSEFYRYATQHLGVNGLALEQYANATGRMAQPMITNLTPNIIEERSLNVIAMDVFSRLMMDRIIFLGYPIDSQVANIIVAQLLFLDSADNSRDVFIYLNSPGGSVYDGLAIYDVMQYIKPDVSTVCVGMAASMGAVLLCAGSAGKRAALPHSRVMIHQPSGGAQGQFSDIEITYKQIQQVREELYKIIAHHSGQPYEKIEADSDRDYWMQAPEAKDYGLIDEVLARPATPAKK
ncbi:MAG: ATP-dependent Clp protease proteolytic subunit [Bacteroidia bacterium]|nr:ATP-dependent Clp protease proteolytic subunit [Bacteroidia bacterium]